MDVVLANQPKAELVYALEQIYTVYLGRCNPAVLRAVVAVKWREILDRLSFSQRQRAFTPPSADIHHKYMIASSDPYYSPLLS